MVASIEVQATSKGSHVDPAIQNTPARSPFAAFIVREGQAARFRTIGIERSLTVLHPPANLHLRPATTLCARSHCRHCCDWRRRCCRLGQSCSGSIHGRSERLYHRFFHSGQLHGKRHDILVSPRPLWHDGSII
jgi:hypothetical protein